LQVARAHVEPFAERLDVHLARIGAGLGQLLRRQAREAVDMIIAVGLVGRMRQAATGQLRMAARISAEPQPVRAVGEQQLALLHRQHRHRGVEPL